MADTFDYAEAREDADELIAEFGQSATLLPPPTVTGPAYDPVSTPADSIAVTIVVLSYSKQEIDGTRIQSTDKKVLMAVNGLSVTPGPDYGLTIGGVPHSIVNVSPLAPGGVNVMFEVQARA